MGIPQPPANDVAGDVVGDVGAGEASVGPSSDPSPLPPVIRDPRAAAGRRVLTGYRPTGKLHLGHLLGNLRNNIELQATCESYFFVADWHALTTGYEETADLRANVTELVADLLASGVDPDQAVVYRQSKVPEVAELFVYLSMITPLGWLERNPTHKEQLRELEARQINTSGNLAYPVLQTADITIVDGEVVPVGEDQLPHLEIAREIVRRLAHLYGEDLLVEPTALLSVGARVPGTDGRKMSKSYENAIYLDDTPEEISEKLRRYITDPQKVRLRDPGRPEICSVYHMHEMFTPADDVEVVAAECRSGERGCVACKAQLAENVAVDLEPIRKRKVELMDNPDEIDDVLAAGAARVHDVAQATITRVRDGVRI